jgi:hypothetical protein
MIRILATALLALSLTASEAFALSMDDLVLTDRLYYKKFTHVPFTGEVDEGYHQGVFKNGEREGPWVIYYENGRPWYKGEYKNGKQEGPWLWYHDNGQLWSKGEYKNGKFEGPWVTYYNDGQLWSKGEYKNGKFEGPWVAYREDGTKKVLSGTYRNGGKVSD